MDPGGNHLKGFGVRNYSDSLVTDVLLAAFALAFAVERLDSYQILEWQIARHGLLSLQYHLYRVYGGFARNQESQLMVELGFVEQFAPVLVVAERADVESAVVADL